MTTLGVEAGHESVFDLVRIAEQVALVEVENVGEIVYAGDQAVDGARFDHVLPLAAQEFLVEDFLQRRADAVPPKSPGPGGWWDPSRQRIRSTEALGVVGLVQSERGAQGPAFELQGQGNLGVEVEAAEQVAGSEARLAAGEAGERSVEGPDEGRVGERTIHAGSVDAGSVQDSDVIENGRDWKARRCLTRLKKVLIALDHAAEGEAVDGLGHESLRLHFGVDGLGEDFAESQPKQERTQVVDIRDGAEAVEVALRVEANFLAAFAQIFDTDSGGAPRGGTRLDPMPRSITPK